MQSQSLRGTRGVFRAVLFAASVVLSSTAAHAIDVPVTYDVDKTAFNAAVLGTSLTFTLYTDSTCTTSAGTDTVLAEDVDVLLESVKLGKVKGGPKPPKIVRLRHTMTGVTAATELFLEVTGTGITPIGGACQAQGPGGGSGPAAPTLGAAEFTRSIQAPNNSVPPGTAFTIDTQVFNNVPADVVPSAGAGGTVFSLTAGTYLVDYEMSLVSAGSVAIYSGPTAGALSLDANTIAGSSTGTTWIHGRAIQSVPTTSVIAISPVVGTADVGTAGSAAGFYMIRLTILKID